MSMRLVFQFAVFPAITEINKQANGEPYAQPRPVRPAQTSYHGTTYQNAQYGYQAHGRYFELSGYLRIGAA